MNKVNYKVYKSVLKIKVLSAASSRVVGAKGSTARVYLFIKSVTADDRPVDDSKIDKSRYESFE